MPGNEVGGCRQFRALGRCEFWFGREAVVPGALRFTVAFQTSNALVPAPAPPPEDKPKSKPTERRDRRTLPIAEERVEVLDSELEATAERIDFEESVLLGWRKGGPLRIVVALAKYRTTSEQGTTTISTVKAPKRTFARSLAAPSLLAKILTDKYCDGLPLYRQEERFEREGVSLDRGTMCRWAFSGALGVIHLAAPCGSRAPQRTTKEAALS